MDSFENSPDTTQVVNDQAEVTHTPEPTSNPVPVSTTPPADTTPKATSKKNYLEIGILLVIIAILAGLVTWYFVSKNQTTSVPQDSDTTDQAIAETTLQPTLVEVNPTMEPRELKILADCKMQKIGSNGNVTLLYDKKDLCNFGNIIIADSREYAQVWDNMDGDSNIKLLSVSDGTLLEFPDDSVFGYSHPVSKSIYSRSFETGSIAIYKGKIGDFKQQKILEFEQKTGGRGVIAEDDIYLAPNSSESYFIYQDTTTADFLSITDSEIDDQIGNVYGGMTIYTINGNKILEISGAFRTRWINDTSFVTLVRNDKNTQLTIRKYTINSDGKYNFVDLYRIEDKSAFGDIYNIDIYDETALLSVYSEEKHYAYIADLAGETTSLIKYSDVPANVKLLNSETLLGYGLLACDPNQEFGSGGDLQCPLDSVFNDYKSSIQLYNTKTKDTTTLIDLEKMYLL